MAREQQTVDKSFSLSFAPGSSKHRPKRVKVNEESEKPEHEYVTGFSEAGATLRDKTRNSHTVNGEQKRVIPTQGNSFRGLGPRAYNPNRFLPQKDELQKPEEGEDRFEVAAPEAKAEVTYGLTTFPKSSTDREQTTEGGPEETVLAETEAKKWQTRKQGRKVINSGQDWETDAYRNDVDNLPEQSTLEEYEAMPVEAFGEAMLRGMGWSEEKAAVEAQAREFVRRAPLLGLGATAAPQSHKEKRFIRPGESREPRKEMVVYDKNGNIKHTKTASDKLVERVVLGPAAGKTMRLLKGNHSGLLCKVETIHATAEGRSQKADVRLMPSEKVVTVRVKELGERDELPEKQSRSRDHESRKHSKRNSKDKSEVPESRDQPTRAALAQSEVVDHTWPVRESEGVAEKPWLAPGIRVKIIDKRMGQGRLYLKKGEVTDVLSPMLCSLVLDSGERCEVDQMNLETVIPKKEGARLLVVLGPLKGQRAKLLKRSSESSQAAVQLTEDFSVHKVSFDEISEFVGELGEEE